MPAWPAGRITRSRWIAAARPAARRSAPGRRRQIIAPPSSIIGPARNCGKLRRNCATPSAASHLDELSVIICLRRVPQQQQQQHPPVLAAAEYLALETQCRSSQSFLLYIAASRHSSAVSYRALARSLSCLSGIRPWLVCCKTSMLLGKAARAETSM